MEPHFDVIPHPAFTQAAKVFYSNYALADFVFVGDDRYSKRNLKHYSNRICRFCGRRYNEVAFSNYSHLLPQLIGNSNLYSDFECDECNVFFGTLENDLAAFLGLSRTIAGLHGERKAPGFLAQRLRAKSRSFIGNNILILAPEDVKREGHTTSITYVKNPYVPCNVFKALLKSALSLLNEMELGEKFKTAMNYLMGRTETFDACYIGGYRLSFNLNIPLHALCFRRKIKEDYNPEYVICLNFQNHIIVVPLAGDTSADWRLALPPPYFLNKTMMNNAVPVPFTRNLSSNTAIVDEEETITFELNPNDFKNAYVYDPSTDKIERAEHGPDSLKYLVLTKESVTINPKELSAFIEEHMRGNQT